MISFMRMWGGFARLRWRIDRWGLRSDSCGGNLLMQTAVWGKRRIQCLHQCQTPPRRLGVRRLLLGYRTGRRRSLHSPLRRILLIPKTQTILR